MRLTIDDSTLITCSVDGSICIWAVKNVKEHNFYMNKKYAKEALVSTNDLRYKIDTTVELNLKIEELTAQSTKNTDEITKDYEIQFQDLNISHSIEMKKRKLRREVRLN